MTRRHDGTSRGTDKPGGGDGRRYDMNGRGAERNGEPGRQAERLMMNDELMRTAREKANCHLPGIYSCPRASSGSSRFSSRFLVSSFISSFCLPAARLACLLASPGVLVVSSGFPGYRFVSFVSYVVSASAPSLLAYRPASAPLFSFALAVSAIVSDAPPQCRPPPDGNRGDETMRRARRRNGEEPGK